MNLERNRLGLGQRPALILVDLINGFTDPACALGSHCPSVVAANAELLSTFRNLGWSVFFTTVVYRNPQQAKVFRNRINALNLLKPESRWVQVDPALTPLASESVLEKQWASAFFGTDLHDRLERAGADSLVVSGLTTSGCVRATVVDGLQHDYRVVVPREAVGDRNPSAHEANLFDMDAKYGDVLGLDAVQGLLARIADGCGGQSVRQD